MNKSIPTSIGDSYVQHALELLQNGKPLLAHQQLTLAMRLGYPIRNLHLVRAVCLSSSAVSYCAFEAVQEELRLFPDNQAARQYLAGITQSAAAQRPSSQTASPSPTFSIIVAPLGGVAAWEHSIRSALYQLYPHIEILLIPENDADDGEFEENDLRIRRLPHPGSNRNERIQLGLGSARGRYLLVMNDPSTRLSDHGLFQIAALVERSPQLDFIVGERAYLDDLNFPQSMRCNYQQWRRELFLDPRAFTPPCSILGFAQALWSKRLFDQVGAECDTTLRHAFEYELLSRFFRVVPPQTVNVPIALERSTMVSRSATPSVGYIAEALSIIHHERQRFPLRPEDSRSRPLEEVAPRKAEGRTEISTRARNAAPHEGLIRLLRERGPRISIVTPSFNQVRFIEQTIDSILGQGYPHLEYLIIDGGSTDGSVEIIKKYAPHLSYWCSERDPGQYFAIQKGLARSSGEIMAWLNSDDKLAEHSLWYLAGLMLARPDIEWVSGLHGAILENGTETGARTCRPYSRQTYLENGFDDPFIQQEGTFWRRSLWEKADSSLDLRYSLAADMDLWRRFFRYAPLLSLDMPIGLFRVHPTQRSHLLRAEYFREAERASRDEWENIRAGSFPTMIPGLAPLTRTEIDQTLARLTNSSFMGR